MADQPAAEKVLPPSPRKLQQAREKGQVARSQDLSSGFSLLVASLGLYVFGPMAFQQMLALMRYYLGDMDSISVTPADMQALLAQAMMMMVPVVVPLMLLLMAASAAVNISQFGFLFTSQAMQPKFERIDPLKGARRMVSLRSLVELIKSLTKLSVIGYIAYLTLRGRIPEVMNLMHSSPWGTAIGVADMVFAVWWRVGLAMMSIGLLDFGYQRWQFHQDQRMTRQEAQDELKQLEGDPRIKQRVRQIQRQMAMQRMMTEVPEAEVVITNPTTYAIALRYDSAQMEAPRVVAKGARIVAQRIYQSAVENGVPIVERPELARTLYRDVEIGHYVPDELFRAVAEVLAYVYEIERREEKLAERAVLL